MDEIDDYDFAPTRSSNLHSLFDSSSESSNNSNLIYTPPKQPKAEVSSETAESKKDAIKTESSVIFAKVVQVWKINNGKYSPLGKHGVAIIGSSVQNLYEIILYKVKTNIIMRCKLCSGFEVFLKGDNCISFSDTFSNNWLMKFETENDYQTFLKHLKPYDVLITKTESTTNSTVDTQPEQASSTVENTAKADILSRIAKMGQSIMPNLKLDEEVIETPPDVKTQIIKPFTPVLNYTKPETSLTHLPNNGTVTQVLPYDPFPIYIAENKANNCEIKLHLAQMNEKLNNILQLVEPNKKYCNCDNEKLKSRLKVFQLQNETLIKEFTQVQEENLKLKQHECPVQDNEAKEQLNEARNKLQIQFERFEEEKKININEKEEFINTIETQKIQINELNIELQATKNILHQNEDEILNLKNEIAELEQKLVNSAPVQTENASPKDQLFSDFKGIMKEEMNELYAKIISGVSETIDSSNLNTIIAQNIKHSTSRIIQKYQQMY